jgi:hypothetical protein
MVYVYLHLRSAEVSSITCSLPTLYIETFLGLVIKSPKRTRESDGVPGLSNSLINIIIRAIYTSTQLFVTLQMTHKNIVVSFLFLSASNDIADNEKKSMRKVSLYRAWQYL